MSISRSSATMAQSNGSMSEEARVIIKHIRSLVISRKDASSVQNIMDDYEELIGKQPSYQKLGFANLEDMLRASGEFLVKLEDGQTRIYAKAKRDSAHICDMVKAQKPAKPTGGVAKRQPASRLKSAVVRVAGKSATIRYTPYSRGNKKGNPKKVSFGNIANNNNHTPCACEPCRCAPVTKSELLRTLPKTSQGREGSSLAKRSGGADKPFSFASQYGNVVAGEFSWNDRNATPVELLVKYSALRGYDRPEYEYFRLKNGRIQCKVIVNGSMYSTYPAEFANEFESQFAAALKAIAAIRADESRNTHEVCLDKDLEGANRTNQN